MSSSPAPYCGWCGREWAPAGHETCARRQSYDPPRYCAHCARRMIVQITPSGWSAACRYHGAIEETGTQR